jgi:hypothetical protein
VRVLVVDPFTPSTLYAGTSSGVSRLFRSDDCGGNWSPISDGLTSHLTVHEVAINPVTPTTLYISTPSGVFRSTDRGDSWAAINSGLTELDVRALVIDPLTPSTLYVGTYGGGVFQSTDGGDSWKAINTGLNRLEVEALAINPATPSIIYAGTWGTGVFRSRDTGDSWTAVNNGLPRLSVGTLAVDPTTPSTLYAGTDGGGVLVYRPEVSFFFPQFVDGALETVQFQSTLSLANTGPSSLVRVEVYRSPDGEPMALTVGELGTGSVFEFKLKKGESISLSTPGTGEPQVGYARIVGGEGVGGVVVFRRTDPETGNSLFEAGVPASREMREFCLFVDSLGVRPIFPVNRARVIPVSYS